MPEEEKYASFFIDHVAQCYNRVAFELIESDKDLTDDHTIVIIDLDSLGWVNDTLGHRSGDFILRKLAGKLMGCAGINNVFRLSGDEFVITYRYDSRACIVDRIINMQQDFNVFSLGIGSTLDKADQNLNVVKSERLKLGLRSSKGQSPPWNTKIIGWIKDIT